MKRPLLTAALLGLTLTAQAADKTPFKFPRLLIGFDFGSGAMGSDDDKYLNNWDESGRVVGAALGYRVSPDWTFELMSRSYEDFVGEQDIPTQYGVFYSTATVEVESMEFTANYHHQWTTYWYSTLGAGISKFERTGLTNINGELFGFDDDGYGVIFRAGVGRRLFHEMTLSLDFTRSEFEDIDVDTASLRLNFEF